VPQAAEVQKMFCSIARRYDLLNRALSLGMDQLWRRRACDALRPLPGEMALDLCSGTGDMALALGSRKVEVFASDFSHEMLTLARRKGVRRPTEADCLSLPFSDRSFDIVTAAFGVRNLADLETGLREILRVLKTGGRVGILEFGSPPGSLFRRLYLLYLRHVVPPVGAALSGRLAAYRYLSTSIQGFPDQKKMKAILRATGYGDVRHLDFTGGIAALYLARRP